MRGITVLKQKKSGVSGAKGPDPWEEYYRRLETVDVGASFASPATKSKAWEEYYRKIGRGEAPPCNGRSVGLL